MILPPFHGKLYHKKNICSTPYALKFQHFLAFDNIDPIKIFYGILLSKQFWKEHNFWSDGFFACSIGEANPETIRRYIENQG